MFFNPATTCLRQVILSAAAAGGNRPGLVILGFFLSSESQGYQNLLTLPSWNGDFPREPTTWHLGGRGSTGPQFLGHTSSRCFCASCFSGSVWDRQQRLRDYGVVRKCILQAVQLGCLVCSQWEAFGSEISHL